MTKRQQLEDLIHSLVRDEIKDEYTLQYVSAEGWYLIPHEKRSFTDVGDYLGRNYNDAIKYIKSREFYSIYG